MRNFHIANFSVELLDFHTSIERHPNRFLYLDPPYANGERLYGDKGDMHESFDHVGLAEILTGRSNWILSYNDCDYIRELYANFERKSLNWTYGMNATKRSNEILIWSFN